MKTWLGLFFLMMACGPAAPVGQNKSADEATESTDESGGASESGEPGENPAVDGGTNTGSTTGDGGTISKSATALTSRIRAAGFAIIPDITSSPASSSLSRHLTYRTSDEDWGRFSDKYNSDILPYIFGNPTKTWGSETQLRYMLRHFEENLISDLLNEDRDAACVWPYPEPEDEDGYVGVRALADADRIASAFFGDIENGPEENRFFDCAVTGETVYEGTADHSDVVMAAVYGVDSAGVTRMILMEEEEGTFKSEFREELRVKKSVFNVAYAEKKEGDASKTYLDLQYAQAIHYSGDDDVFDKGSDDTFFKSRSRLTGHVVFDAEGVASLAKGEFTVTGYNTLFDDANVELITTTKSFGRGGYGDGEISLFQIETDAKEELIPSNGVYCIAANTATGMPDAVNETRCGDLEFDFSWGSEAFPFPISPALPTEFGKKSFFEEENLISNSMEDFSIPAYETAE
ncbi:MAG: hypothetical protein Q7T11_08165 [Deltaproteobacteria bacterium]|nr:hypothetical protein [Deltaproteobacteria bacterium]